MFTLEVLTPDGVAFRSKAESASIPTSNGEITVLEGHVPLVTTLGPGMLTVHTADGEDQYFALSRGVVQVEKDSIKILSDIADRVDALDEQAILDARKRAEELVATRKHDTEGFIEASALLDRELARLRSVRRRRPRTF